MIGRILVLAVAVAAVVIGGCGVEGIITSSQPRIWVIRGGSQVFRCAEPEESGPPRPVCVAAHFTNGSP
jgi:hypothetical protein